MARGEAGGRAAAERRAHDVGSLDAPRVEHREGVVRVVALGVWAWCRRFAVTPEVEPHHPPALGNPVSDIGPHVLAHVDAVDEEHRQAVTAASRGLVDAGQRPRGAVRAEQLGRRHFPPITPGT